MPKPTVEEVIRKVEWDNGLLVWKHRLASEFSTEGRARTWNRKYARQHAAHMVQMRLPCGRWQNRVRVTIAGQCVSAANVAWVLAHGEWPPGRLVYGEKGHLHHDIENLRCPEAERLAAQELPCFL